MLNFIARGKKLYKIRFESETERKAYPKEWIEGALTTFRDGCQILDCNYDLYDVDPDTICWKCPESEYWTNDILKVTIDDGDWDDPLEWIVVVDFSEGCFMVDIWYDDFMGIPIHRLDQLGFKVEKIGNTIDNPEIFEPHKP